MFCFSVYRPHSWPSTPFPSSPLWAQPGMVPRGASLTPRLSPAPAARAAAGAAVFPLVTCSLLLSPAVSENSAVRVPHRAPAGTYPSGAPGGPEAYVRGPASPGPSSVSVRCNWSAACPACRASAPTPRSHRCPNPALANQPQLDEPLTVTLLGPSLSLLLPLLTDPVRAVLGPAQTPPSPS